jgi:hypothetical protein
MAKLFGDYRSKSFSLGLCYKTLQIRNLRENDEFYSRLASSGLVKYTRQTTTLAYYESVMFLQYRLQVIQRISSFARLAKKCKKIFQNLRQQILRQRQRRRQRRRRRRRRRRRPAMPDVHRRRRQGEIFLFVPDTDQK